MEIINIILIFSVIIYAAFLKKFTLTYFTLNNGWNYFKTNSVSIIIAARNEESCIANLLNCLIKQNYPHDKFEIIIANDNSTDNTAKIIEDFQSNYPQINITTFITENRDQAISPKKNALQQAIDKSKNEIILLTDADCTMENNWLVSMVSSYDDDTDFVAGFSKTDTGKNYKTFSKTNIISKWEFFDFVLMFIFTAGAMKQKKYFSCSGQNISYRKNAFYSVGGFSKIEHLISGDDVNLLQLFRKEDKKIKFCFDKNSFTTTGSITKLKTLLNQRSRWASNFTWQLKANFEFAFFLLVSYFTVVLPVILLIRGDIFLGLALPAIRIILEYRILKLGFKAFNIDSKIITFYPVWFLLQIIYMIVVPLPGLFKIFKWK